MAASMDDGRVRSDRAATLREVLVAFLVASGVAALLSRAQSVGFIHKYLHAMVAAVFLFLPQLMLGRRADLESYGLRARPVALGLKVAAIFVFGVLPCFALGFFVWNRFLCAHWPALVPGSCWHLAHPAFRLPPDFLSLALAQVVVVALPEELFFRGYLQGRLEDALPPTHTLLGAKVGCALVLQALLFGVGHFLVTFDPAMLTRAIPGLLFGWMYARTRSILAGTIFHAACNLLMELLASSLL